MIRRNLMIVGSIVTLILFFDQVLKIWTKTQVAFMDEPIQLIGSWFKLVYIENQGMAFGTTLGTGIWAKLSLSIFRIIAITGIAWYWVKQAKEGVKLEFLIAIGFIFSGAIGNLIDSMLYDFIFKFDPCLTFNHLEGSGIKTDCGFFGTIETRPTGFLLGNVVDMFKFDATWPTWVPIIGTKQVFPAIWNLADASISIGVIFIFIRQKAFFQKNNIPKI